MDRFLIFVQQNRGLFLFLVLLIAVFLMLRNRPTEVASLAGLEAMVGRGQPAIIEFYSNT